MQGTTGVLSKDKFTGKFVDEWNNYLKTNNVEFENKDVSPVMAGVLAIKDEDEIVSVRLQDVELAGNR